MVFQSVQLQKVVFVQLAGNKRLDGIRHGSFAVFRDWNKLRPFFEDAPTVHICYCIIGICIGSVQHTVVVLFVHWAHHGWLGFRDWELAATVVIHHIHCMHSMAWWWLTKWRSPGLTKALHRTLPLRKSRQFLLHYSYFGLASWPASNLWPRVFCLLGFYASLGVQDAIGSVIAVDVACFNGCTSLSSNFLILYCSYTV